MSIPSLAQYVIFLLIVTALVRPVGGYIWKVFDGQRTLPDPFLRPVEKLFYRVARIDPTVEMNWKTYALSFVVFSVFGIVALTILLLIQSALPGYQSAFMTTPMTVDLAANTAISFATTTTWQAYGGETTMSYISQVVGLAAQNFLAGATGLAVGIAFMRGLARQNTTLIGNFWVDLTRGILWVLLPAAVVYSLLLVWQGVPMNFNTYTEVKTLAGESQIIAQGPVAALEVPKNLGTNGGGFFNVNAAHPYENPTPLTNILHLLAIAVLPASLTYTFGKMVGRPSHGWMLYGVMVFLFTLGLITGALAEQSGNPAITALNVDTAATAEQSGGNMEGKETRFGIHGSVIAAITTSNGATGSYNAMHDSFTPLGGMIPLINMLLGELIFGGLGSGIYSIVVMVLISIFIGGLMVGRSPEYLGKSVEIREIKLVGFYTIVSAATILILTALAVISDAGRAGLTTNTGAHGFSEILTAYTTSFANNGQNFAGLSGNSVFYNVTTGIAMLVGRFALGGLALALAGEFAEQRRRPVTSGTLPTETLLFIVLLIAVIIIVGALTFFPALAMGPIVEHLMMTSR